MKRFLVLTGAMALIVGGLVSTSLAAPTDTVAITVTVTNLSVNVEDVSWAIGAQLAGATVSSASSSNAAVADGITVANDGNVTETFQLHTGGSDNWANANAVATGNSAGANSFVLRAIFDTAVAHTFEGTGDDVTNTATSASATRFTDGDATGASVGATTNRLLWLQFVVPTSDTSTVQQTITLTVTAIAG